MKAYVLSENAMDRLGAKDARARWEVEAVTLSQVSNAMTPIDIPDGCQLAVVKLVTVEDERGTTDQGRRIVLRHGEYRVVQVVEVK